MTLVRSGLALAFACTALQALAQYALEFIPLRHRTVDQVLPALQPLLEPGATLTGQSGQLIVRTSPANLAELRRALEAIDVPSRRLQILVRFEGAADTASRDASASGAITNRGSRVELRAVDTRTGEAERIDQRLQVVEGGTAWISTGQSRTLPQRQLIRTPGGVVSQETFVVQEATTGFAVVPRLAGQTVRVEIGQQRETLGPRGSVQSAQLASTASAPLGEWFEIGNGTWLKVEELRN